MKAWRELGSGEPPDHSRERSFRANAVTFLGSESIERCVRESDSAESPGERNVRYVGGAEAQKARGELPQRRARVGGESPS